MASTPSGSSAYETHASLWKTSYFCQASVMVKARVAKTDGLVANRRKPCCVDRQKWQSVPDRASNQALADGWCVWDSNVNASQTLTSGSSIFFVQNLGNHFAGQMKAPRLLGGDQWQLNASTCTCRLGSRGFFVRDGDDGAFRQV